MTDMRWKQAQRRFFYVLAATVCVSMTVQLFWLPYGAKQPAYTLRHDYVTSSCEDGRRLGNLMFNYASLIGIARRYNMTPVMEEDFPLFDLFTLTVKRSGNIENTLGMHRDYEEFGKRACAYDVHTEHFQPPLTGLKLHGYFQSWKYFEHAYPHVREEFKFKDDLLSEAKLFHSKVKLKLYEEETYSIRNKKIVRVGIHIRRGDVLDGHYSNYGYNTPDKNYYAKAMQYFHKHFPDDNLLFIVCSDDMSWAQENVQGAHIVHSDATSAGVDLAILSLCDHVIMSVGSFGWWAAWLANGTTLYYGDWPRPVSMLEYMVTKPDYFLPSWVPIYDKW